MVLRKLLNTFGVGLLLQLKSRSARGASHHPAFMANWRTISHMFYSSFYSVDDRNEDVRLVRKSKLMTFSSNWEIRFDSKINC